MAHPALRNNFFSMSDGFKSCCASICTVVPAVAIPVLVYIALLCGAGSRLIEIPQEKKTDAAVGCWVAAILYDEYYISHYYIPVGTQLHFSCRITTRLVKRWSKRDLRLMVISCIPWLPISNRERNNKYITEISVRLCCVKYVIWGWTWHLLSRRCVL